MVDIKLSEYYERAHGKPLVEPSSVEEVQNVLEAIRVQHGYLDDKAQADFQTLDERTQIQFNMILAGRQKELAQLAKT